MRSILVLLLLFLLPAQACFAQIDFRCDSGATGPESIRAMKALRALYLCQQSADFNKCGALAGLVAGRNLTPQQRASAESLISADKDALLVPTTSGSDELSSRSLIMDVAILLSGGPAAKIVRWANEHLPLISSTGCSAASDQFYNTKPSAGGCQASLQSFDRRTLSFLSADEKVWTKGLSYPEVCRHYQARLRTLIPRDFSDLVCGKGVSQSGLTSGIVRTIFTNEDKTLKKVVVKDQATLIETEIEFASDNRMKSFRTGSSGASHPVLPINRLRSSHPHYEHIARLHLEASEIASCCSNPQIGCAPQMSDERPQVAIRNQQRQ